VDDSSKKGRRKGMDFGLPVGALSRMLWADSPMQLAYFSPEKVNWPNKYFALHKKRLLLTDIWIKTNPTAANLRS